MSSFYKASTVASMGWASHLVLVMAAGSAFLIHGCAATSGGPEDAIVAQSEALTSGTYTYEQWDAMCEQFYQKATWCRPVNNTCQSGLTLLKPTVDSRGVCIPSGSGSSACTSSEYEVSPPTPTSGRVCAPVTQCTSFEYEVSPPTATRNRVCDAITECSELEYELHAPSPTSDRVCSAITACGEHEYEVSPPSPTSDRVCAPIVATCDAPASEVFTIHAGAESLLLGEATRLEFEVTPGHLLGSPTYSASDRSTFRPSWTADATVTDPTDCANGSGTCFDVACARVRPGYAAFDGAGSRVGGELFIRIELHDGYCYYRQEVRISCSVEGIPFVRYDFEGELESIEGDVARVEEYDLPSTITGVLAYGSSREASEWYTVEDQVDWSEYTGDVFMAVDQIDAEWELARTAGPRQADLRFDDDGTLSEVVFSATSSTSGPATINGVHAESALGMLHWLRFPPVTGVTPASLDLNTALIGSYILYVGPSGEATRLRYRITSLVRAAP